MLRLAIITTHPIQYYAPIFRLLAQQPSLLVRIFYTWNPVESQNYDPGFGRLVEWDIPLLDGYDYTFVDNTSAKPGTNHFQGIINPNLIYEIEAWKAQKILVFGWNYNSHLQAIRYFKGKLPVFFRGDSHLLDEKPGLKLLIRRMLLRWIYSHIDAALYVGRNNKKYFLSHGLREHQLLFAPHAIDNSRFAVNSEDLCKEAMNWRKDIGIPEGSFTFIFAGKLEPKKDPVLLLKAFIQLQRSDLHLIFIGNGVLEEELKTIAAPYSNVHFIDFQNQSKMPVAYRLGNIFVLPSQGPGETWGLAVNEAMACSLPVLVSNKVGCGVDLVHNGANGYIFTSGNLMDLTEKMNKFILMKDKLAEMGNRSNQIIQSWSIQKTADCIAKAVIE